MLGFVPTIANLARSASLRLSAPKFDTQAGFPAHAFAYWEGQGQSNMTGFNQISDAPAALRVMNPDIKMMTDDPGWRPYGLLIAGQTFDLDGVTYSGKFDEAEIPLAAGGAGPLIGIHEAMLNGDMTGPLGLLAAGILIGKFSDAGKPLTAFLPGFDDGSAPLGGTNFNARGAVFPGLLRARLAAGDDVYHQGKIWFQGETDAATARAAGDVADPAISGYATSLAGLRAFERAQINLPDAPWYMVTIAEKDAYAAAINDALASLCRWHVGPDGTVSDLGVGRDGTSYIIDHMIQPVGDVHFTMTQMRAIGALVWKAHQHLAGAEHGLSAARQILMVSPVWQRTPEIELVDASLIRVNAISNEAGALHVLAVPAGSPTPDAATVRSAGVAASGLRGRAVTVSVADLSPTTAYDLWTVYSVPTGEETPLVQLSATTGALPVTTAWTPGTIGARSWWDAQNATSITQDAGVVTAWADLSGRGIVLSATEPSRSPLFNPTGLNGFPSLDFDGQADLQGNGAGLAADMCLMIVAQVDAVTNGSEAIIDFQTQNLAIRAQHNSEFRARYELMNGTNTNISPSPVIDYKGAPHIFVSRYDSAADLVEVWIDGVLVASQATYLTDLAATDNIRIMRPFDGALRTDGKVGEVALVASATPEDRARLEGYAAHRWGLAGSLPATHPWKSAAP